MNQKRKLFSFLHVKNIKFWYFKYTVGAIITVLLVTFLTVHFGFTYSRKLITALSTHAQQANIALSLETIVEILKNVQIRLMIAFIIEGVVLILVGIVASLYLAYRIIGPLDRIQREIDDMLQGRKPIHSITVRKGDYITPFVELINKLINTTIR